jgi:hypothetical protein
MPDRQGLAGQRCPGGKRRGWFRRRRDIGLRRGRDIGLRRGRDYRSKRRGLFRRRRHIGLWRNRDPCFRKSSTAALAELILNFDTAAAFWTERNPLTPG